MFTVWVSVEGVPSTVSVHVMEHDPPIVAVFRTRPTMRSFREVLSKVVVWSKASSKSGQSNLENNLRILGKNII